MNLLSRLQGYQVTEMTARPSVAGKLTRVVGLTLEAIGCRAAVGSLCRIDTLDGYLEAEVVGFSGEKLFLMPSEQLKGVIPGAKVTPIGDEHGIPVGMNLLGRVIDGVGQPLDGLGPILTAESACWSTAGSTRWRASPSTNRWTSGCERSTRCSPSVKVSGWDCLPAQAWVSRCCWA